MNYMKNIDQKQDTHYIPDMLFFDFRVDFVKLALDNKPVNLGQGFPDDLIPEYAINALKDVATEPVITHHQYSRGFVSILGYLRIVV